MIGGHNIDNIKTHQLRPEFLRPELQIKPFMIIRDLLLSKLFINFLELKLL